MQSKYWLVLAAATSFMLGSIHLTQAQETPTVPAPAGPLDSTGTPLGVGGVAPTIEFSEVIFPHGIFAAAIEKRLNKDGSIDYAGLKNDPQLKIYVDDVARADRAKFPVVGLGIDPKKPKAPEQFDHSFETAYLINAYNALIVYSLAQQYPTNSPSDIKGFYTDKTRNVAGKMVSFQELRDEIQARDPRAFFALITGTKGGPVLPPDPYTYSTLDSMLDNAVEAYISDPRHVQVLRINGKVTIDDYLQGADPLFALPNAKGTAPDRKQWAGVKRVLQVYSSSASDKRYFNAGDYKIEWAKTNTGLNYENATLSTPSGGIGAVNPGVG